MGIRVGIDIGGTFTDLVGISEETGEFVVSVKTPTSPQNPALGVMEALKKSGIDPNEITYFVHGSTLGLNSLVENKQSDIGLICTKGFRDTLEIRRVWRETLFDAAWERPASLIRRKLRRGIMERVDWQGNILTPLNEQEVHDTVRFLKAQGVISYAVCLLFSFLNPHHERRVKEIILTEHPGAFVSLSCEILPEIREYERTSTTVLNAILKPIMLNYVNSLQKYLKEIGICSPLRILKFNGGVVDTQTILEKPVEAFSCGPVGGVMGAVHFCLQKQLPNVITLDMGGTSTDISVIQDYQPLFTMEKNIAWNIPIRGSMLDVRSIGAGGGSIAWFDNGNSLKVGPQSAGALPGPACYKMGGLGATITDAQLYLGRINPSNFLKGDMPLYPNSSIQALEALGSIQGFSDHEIAYKIYQISMNDMVQMIREMTINQGKRPEEFVLVCYGGAGAMYAADLAEEMGIPEIYIPINAGVFSALGCLCADVILDYLQTYYVPLSKLDFKRVNRIISQLYQNCISDIQNHYPIAEARFSYLLDLRYVGEAFEITVPVKFEDQLTRRNLEETIDTFHKEHKRLYGFNRLDEPLELVNVRLRVSIPQPKPIFSPYPKLLNAESAFKEHRQIYFRSTFEFVSTPIYDWKRLGQNVILPGPAVIEDGGTTVVIPPHDKCLVDEFGNLRIIVNQRLMLGDQEANMAKDPITTRLFQMERTSYIQPVAKEVLASALESICREMGTTMLHTAYSPIFADGMDFSCGILDDEGELVAAVNYCPVHLAAMSLAPEWVLLEIGINDLQPGDVILTNDPYRGGTHITDFTIIKPIFFDGEIVAMATNRAHHLDIGGKAAGGFPGDATEIFQEGILLPPVKWFKGGVENTDIFDTLLANVRLPSNQIGDFRAQLAAVLTSEQRILQLCRYYGASAFKQSIKRLKDYSEAWMRKEIQAIPDGTYSYADFIEDDGITSEARNIQVTIEVKGDNIIVDFSGTSQQATGPLNAVYGVTVSSTFNALLQITNPLIPINRGLFRPVKIIAPRGTLVNPYFPAATFGANTETNLRIVEVVIGALAKVLPNKVMAATYGTCNNLTGGGYDPIRDQPFVFYFFNEGGWGARYNRDGLTSTFNPIGNCKDVPVEIVESNYPFLYEMAELNPDSEGAGEFRGGFGTIRTLKVLTDQIEINALGERHKLKPYGLFGGKPAQTNSFLVQRNQTWGNFAQVFGTISPSKFANIRLHNGDRFSIVMSGGGGYGNPLDRDPFKVLADVEEEVISTLHAEQEYGVIINNLGDMRVLDYRATAKQRSNMRREPINYVINDVITVDELSFKLRAEQPKEIPRITDKVLERLNLAKELLDRDFCTNICFYKANSKTCPLYNNEALQFWSISTLRRWARKRCFLKIQL